MPQSFIKDPDDVLDYQVDWSVWLAESSPVDTINTSTWTELTGNITIDSESEGPTNTTVWLSGGTSGQKYVLTNRIATIGGRSKDDYIMIIVNEKT